MFIAFAGFAAAAALAASGSGPDFEQARISSAQDSGAKMLYVCERDAISKRTFKQLHGEVKFVTAKSLLAKQGGGDQWAAPRCITSGELRRLETSTSDLIQIRHRARQSRN